MRLILLFGLIAIAGCSENNETFRLHRVTHRAWFDIGIGKEYAGRIEIGLFGRLVPITVNNFVSLATRPRRQGYRGTRFHKINMNFIEGGDWISGDGANGRSSYDTADFDDENFEIKHYGAGWVSAKGHGKNAQTSIFLITLRRVPELDGVCVVFGKVINGMSVVRKISNVPTNEKGVPNTTAFISNCGAELIDPPFYTAASDATD